MNSLSGSKNTNLRVPTPSNPSSLPPRYEIRQLQPEHLEWVMAIVIHSNVFYSPVWTVLYPDYLTDKLHEAMRNGKYLFEHQIKSGLSFGVFDTEYTFKRAESAPTGGKLYWDESEPEVKSSQGVQAESKRLLEQMDFPLVSVAMSYDGINALDLKKMEPMLQVLPHFGLIYHILDVLDQRAPETWKATGDGQVLMRNATSTRRDYEGQGIMAALARWLMREAAGKGYRGIQIESINNAVAHVWGKAEPPFEGTVISEFDTATWADEEGKHAFEPAKQVCKKIWVDLKATEK
ncbi:hypothetical protein BU24DRAFT_419455 [Aaosphaeria arxii CBS 175.79]|uniref:N-acetyltransferase domain-containing protein n=1 Tax=Aaosphaeria arxii CBS 175.79 TaxID=1450172 RepID=A0A6A5Y4N5_9PLEO|nr:uncharacterized protein BU24DRAFT_419455 [Aaosphaeria arxii CBS 175.79]KAF2019841.1 hypothetical protein BU24DRAFT_419455 [Aaosphaeria arxii CBS 175.79]